MKTLKRNEIPKGAEVRLRSGMRARIEDGYKRRHTRLATVYGSEVGLFDEMGSVYAHDIAEVKQDGEWIPVTTDEV